MKKVAIVAGGNSGEHDISLLSAKNVFDILDKRLFKPYLIHIKGVDWTCTAEDGTVYSIDKNDFSLTMANEKIFFDVVFIAIHGTPGEDGKLQGYFDMLNIPYTGCDLFTSALTFNKYFCNLTVAKLGIPIAASLHFYKGTPIDAKNVRQVCGFPCFVKPCNSGSSVGVSKVHNEEELYRATTEAFKHDKQILIEAYLAGKEVTCGVLESKGEIVPLTVTEIISENEFYDFESKYTDNLHSMVTPAPISKEAFQKIMDFSKKIFLFLDCKGVARIDYIVTADGTPYFLEINTIPGQTAMSIIPHQIEYLGKELQETYTEIITNALL